MRAELVQGPNETRDDVSLDSNGEEMRGAVEKHIQQFCCQA
jgi:hypothetical protein